MLTIAIVDDEIKTTRQLKDCLLAYAKKHGVKFAIHCFENGSLFLDSHFQFDIVFIDIVMPGIDGIHTAKRFREYDRTAVIIFVTAMLQCAINGYEVSALDFVVKPIDPVSFEHKIRKAINATQKNETIVSVLSSGQINRFSANSILYIEVLGHKLYYYTDFGVVTEWEKLTTAQEKLPVRFLRPNQSFLVNPKHIAAVNGNTCRMNDGTDIQISRLRKVQFMEELTKWIGENS